MAVGGEDAGITRDGFWACPPDEEEHGEGHAGAPQPKFPALLLRRVHFVYLYEGNHPGEKKKNARESHAKLPAGSETPKEKGEEESNERLLQKEREGMHTLKQ